MSDAIVPDDKNWTWVLERACPDCGFASASFDETQSAAAVRDLAARWQVVLARPDAAVRSVPSVWSSLEYGCHVRDVFRIFHMRLWMMLQQNDPHFANWDQDKTAIDDQYSQQQPSVVAGELADAAAALADRFAEVRGDQWQRRGLRSDGSAFTVASIAKYLMHDPVHHLWDVGAEVPTY